MWGSGRCLISKSLDVLPVSTVLIYLLFLKSLLHFQTLQSAFITHFWLILRDLAAELSISRLFDFSCKHVLHCIIVYINLLYVTLRSNEISIGIHLGTVEQLK
jgi:hypothetical protein